MEINNAELSRLLFEKYLGFKVSRATCYRYLNLLEKYGYSDSVESIKMLSYLRGQTRNLDLAFEGLRYFESLKISQSLKANKGRNIVTLFAKYNVPEITENRWLKKVSASNNQIEDYQIDLLLVLLYIYLKNKNKLANGK